MKVLKEEFATWREMAITQGMLQELAEAAGAMVETIVNRRSSEPMDDQYLKGYIAGLSSAAGWIPELVEVLDEEEEDE